MVDLQSSTFWQQSLACTIIYLPFQIVSLVVINTYKTWSYDSLVIFNNLEFNLTVIVLMIMGVMSLLLSSNPNVFDAFQQCQNFLDSPLVTMRARTGHDVSIL